MARRYRVAGRSEFPRRNVWVERLEGRMLLAVTAGEYGGIRSTYADFGLPEDMGQVNVIEITPDQLSVASLKDAIATAAGTDMPDLVVVRTSDAQNTIMYTSADDAMVFNIPASQGAISIVGLGTEPLTLDAAGQCRVMCIGGGGSTTTANLGGMLLTRGVAERSPGGGINQWYGTLRLENVTISDSTGSYGGGVYLEGTTSTFANVTISGNKSLDLSGGGVCLFDGTSTLTNVTISGNTSSGTDFSSGGGLYVHGATATLTNVAITGNTAYSGGGVYVDGGASMLTDVTITGNTATGYSTGGGGIFLCNSTATLTNVTISENTAFSGGGVYVNNGTSTLTDVTITGNSASGYDGGGGMYLYYGTSMLTNVAISGNIASVGDGGGMYQSYGTLTLTDTTISGNTAQSGGGGAYLAGGTAELMDVKISGNTASAGGGLSVSGGTTVLTNVTVSDNVVSGTYSSGGGLYLYQGTSTLTNVTVSGNSSTSDGGGVYLNFGTSTLMNVTISGNTGRFGGGVYQYAGTSTLTDVTISGNTAYGGRGGGVYLSGTSTLRNVVISGNVASGTDWGEDGGGGLLLEDGSATLTNVTISGNMAPGRYSYGGGMCQWDSTSELRNTLIAQNIATTGPDIYEISADGSISGGNNLIGNGADQMWLVNGVGNNLVGTPDSPVDPRFINMTGTDWVQWNLRLQLDSPAVNSGNNAWIPAGVTTDIDGVARVIWGTVDIGAYEARPELIASVISPAEEQSREVTISYKLWDDQSNPCSIVVEYSLDGGASWQPATAGAGGDGMTNLQSNPWGQAHTFVWASDSDIVNTNRADVSIRITPDDGTAGMAGVSQGFRVGNLVDQAPTDIALSLASVPEDQPIGTVVGRLASAGTDWPDWDDTFTYSLVSGTGSTDNASFGIVGNQLITAAPLSYLPGRTLSIRVRAADADGNGVEKVFAIEVTSLPEFGHVDGQKAKSLRITDTDGDVVTFKLSGGGYGALLDRKLSLIGTTGKSALTISVMKSKGGDGVYRLNGITSDGLLKGIIGSAVVLAGQVRLNTLNQTPGTTGVSIQLQQCADASIEAQNLAIASLKLRNWQDTDAMPDELITLSIGSITITGQKENPRTVAIEYLPGDLDASITTAGGVGAIKTAGSITGTIRSGEDAKGNGIGSIVAGGGVSGATIVTSGSIGTVSAAAVFESDILVGVATDFTDRFATGYFDFVNRDAKLGSLRVTGWKLPKGRSYPAFFVDSHISAPNVGTVSLLNVPVGSEPIVYVFNDVGVLKVERTKRVNEEMVGSGTWKAGEERPGIWAVVG